MRPTLSADSRLPRVVPHKVLAGQTALVTGAVPASANAKGVSKELRGDHADFVSPDLITFNETELGFREGFVVRDPDGHALRIVEP
jgi:hypothetical protein